MLSLTPYVIDMTSPTPSLLLFNKPFQVLTQFTSKDGKACLADVIKAPGMRPAGRLDYDSEGLLLITSRPQLLSVLTNPQFRTPKVYLVQVEGSVNEEALEKLRRGVRLADGPTLPADAKLIEEPQWLWPRDPPIRFRREIPTSWIELTIREGRNRQVRRMTAAVDNPTLRLIRWSVGPWTLEGLKPGESRSVDENEIQRFLAAKRRATIPPKSPYRRSASRASRR
ncbi:MAG TPA: pseudouridine synthase [Steroidobacteraceae bacterium]|nr:pseudouridine synthase [Steroidobacteraceae bacterium]